MPDEENLGLAHLLIPGAMATRFAKECGPQHDSGRYLLPRYSDLEEMDGVSKHSSHECYNADTQIVLMNWLFAKRRKYKLEYQGLDPFWLFHDSFHAENDVYSNEVNNIYSYVERTRLLEGAEFAQSKGVFMLPETVAKLDANWRNRWKFREQNTMTPLQVHEFYQFMTPEDQEQCDFYIDCGTFHIN